MAADLNKNTINWKEETHRSALTKSLTIAAYDNPDIMMMVADLGQSMRAKHFSDRFPDRFMQCGIAENNMVGMASGLASCGKIPFVVTFTPFVALRCCEQIRSDVAYPNSNVKIAATDSGVFLGTLGVTHYGLEDLGVMRALPNITILSPSDGPEIFEAVQAAVKIQGPVYIRLGGKDISCINREGAVHNTDLIKADILKDGSDITIISTGSLVATSLKAAQLLKNDKIDAGIINIRSIKPIDTETIKEAVSKSNLLVSVEEHFITGGLGTAVAEILAEHGRGKLLRLGIPDEYDVKVAPYYDLLERYGLTPESIAKNIKNFINKESK